MTRDQCRAAAALMGIGYAHGYGYYIKWQGDEVVARYDCETMHELAQEEIYERRNMSYRERSAKGWT